MLTANCPNCQEENQFAVESIAMEISCRSCGGWVQRPRIKQERRYVDGPEPPKKPPVALILSGVIGVVVALLVGVNLSLGSRVKPKPPEPVIQPQVWRNVYGETAEQAEETNRRAKERIRQEDIAYEKLMESVKKNDEAFKKLQEAVRKRDLDLQIEATIKGWELKRMDEDLQRFRQIVR